MVDNFFSHQNYFLTQKNTFLFFYIITWNIKTTFFTRKIKLKIWIISTICDVTTSWVFHSSSFVITWVFVTIWVVTPDKNASIFIHHFFTTVFTVTKKICPFLKTAHSSSRMWSLVYQIVNKSFKPSYLCDSSDGTDSSDSSDSSDISDSNDSCDSSNQKTIFTKTIIHAKKNVIFHTLFLPTFNFYYK